MPILNLQQAKDLPPGQLRDWAYNALDVTGTREVADVLLPRLSPAQRRTYAFERALNAPALSMMLEGVDVDEFTRRKMIVALKREMEKDIRALNKLKEISDVWDLTEKETGICPTRKPGKNAKGPPHHKWPRGVPEEERSCECCGTSRLKIKPFNANSADQVDHLFYDLLKVPVMLNKQKKRSTDGDILERIGNKYPQHRVITDAIFAIRDKKKQLGTLGARLSKAGRYPSSFNVGAAWTGRFSSSKNPYGEGGNLQNLAERHRVVFTAEAGGSLVYADLKQAESNVVAHISGDQTYIDAHKSGDVHTYVARLVWPELPWTGDLKKDKKVAKALPDWDPAPGHDFRFQAKRIQHGSNFGLSPYGISMIARIPLQQAEAAQRNYFGEFPYIRQWQKEIAEMIRRHEPLVNVLGREITLMGRPWDDHTVKQGLAFIPQSSVADILDLAMWRVWRELDVGASLVKVRLKGQIHDALLAWYPNANMEVLHEMRRLMQIPIPVNGRIMQIEAEIAVGRNWGKRSEANPHGMYEPPEYND